jgi:hypothetical protein
LLKGWRPQPRSFEPRSAAAQLLNPIQFKRRGLALVGSDLAHLGRVGCNGQLKPLFTLPKFFSRRDLISAGVLEIVVCPANRHSSSDEYTKASSVKDEGIKATN